MSTRNIIKLLFDNFFAIKLIFGIVVSGFLGSNVLESLNILATYRYSAYFGIRFPLEGIPYLQDAVSYGGFILTVLVALSFVFINYLLEFLTFLSRGNSRTSHNFFETIWYQITKNKKYPKNLDDLINKSSTKKSLLIIFTSSTIFGISLFTLGKITESESPNIFALIGFTYTLVISLIQWKKQLTWIFTSFGVLAILFITISLAFNPLYYAKFLRLYGYGGGIPVYLTLDNQKTNQFGNVEDYLVLRTSESYMIFNKTMMTIKELKQKEYSIIYPINSKDDFFLPSTEKIKPGS